LLFAQLDKALNRSSAFEVPGVSRWYGYGTMAGNSGHTGGHSEAINSRECSCLRPISLLSQSHLMVASSLDVVPESVARHAVDEKRQHEDSIFGQQPSWYGFDKHNRMLVCKSFVPPPCTHPEFVTDQSVCKRCCLVMTKTGCLGKSRRSHCHPLFTPTSALRLGSPVNPKVPNDGLALS